MRRDVLRSPLPTLDGVAPSRQTLPAAGRWETVLDFLSERHPLVGVQVWAARMREGRVLDEAGRRVMPESPYRAGACVHY